MGQEGSSKAAGGPRRPGATGSGIDPRLRAHLITTVILVLVVAAIALVWTRPILLLWLFLAVVAIMAYAAIYLLVSARLVEDEDADDEPPAPRPPRPGDVAAPPPGDEDEA